MSNIKKARELFIKRNRENASLVALNDLDFAANKIKRIFYDDLINHDLTGYYPIGSQYVDKDFIPSNDKNAKLCFYFAKNYHEIYLGTTGSGKTTGCVEPQLRAITASKVKPHVFVTDPKGEIFEHNAIHLQKQGYRIRILNFRNPHKTNYWNPIGEIYDTYIQIFDVGKGAVERAGKVLKKLKPFRKKSVFSEDFYIDYDGFAFATAEEYNDYLDSERAVILSQTEDIIMQFIPMIIEVKSSREPIWEQGAQRVLRGFIYYMLEEINFESENTMTREMFTIRTIRDLYTKTNAELYVNEMRVPLLDTRTFSHKTDNDNSVKLLKPIFQTAESTMKGFLATFDAAVQSWFNEKIIMLTLDDTMDIDFEDDVPMATFLVTRDYEKSDFLVAGLFIDWLYRTAVQAHENKKLNRELHFLLDEFGNIPAIKNFENKIATSRSRNIWFHLILQSYAQLDRVYDAVERGTAEIIKDNCNSQIFLGSQNHETKVEFSKQCGEMTYPDFKTSLAGEVKFVTTNVLPISKLDLVEIGEIYNKRIYMPVITSHYVRSYLCKEFTVDRNLDGFDIVDTEIINPMAKKYWFEVRGDRAESQKKKFDLDDYLF